MARRRAQSTQLPAGIRPAAPGPDGAPRWQARWWVDGREHRVLISAPTARAAAAERARRIETGNPYGAAPDSGVTVAEAADRCLALRVTHSTKIHDRANLRKLSRAFGRRTLASLTLLELQRWFDGLRRDNGQPYNLRTLKAIRRSCRVLWTWAVKEGLVEMNIAQGVTFSDRQHVSQGPAPEAAKRHLTIQELRAVLGILALEAPDVANVCARTQLRLGLRVSEVVCLRVDLIDWDTGLVTIDRAFSHGELSPTKRKRRSHKYLSQEGRAELRGWLDRIEPRDGYVFTKPTISYNERWPFIDPRTVVVPVRAAIDKLGGLGLAKGTTTHAFRHSWYEIARDFENILTDDDIAAVLGNRAETAAKSYASGPGFLARRIADHLERVVFAAHGEASAAQ